MKKVSIVIMGIIALIATSQVKAQGDMKIGASLGIMLPMGDFGDAAKMGIGGMAEYKYMVAENVAIGANLGYYSFGMKDYDDGSYSIMPIVATGEYLFKPGEKLNPYVGANLGIYNFKTSVTLMNIDASTSVTKFGFAPVLGILYELSDQMDFNANLRYNMIFTDETSTTTLGLNLGILYKL